MTRFAIFATSFATFSAKRPFDSGITNTHEGTHNEEE
jgi:hypothetical protein